MAEKMVSHLVEAKDGWVKVTNGEDKGSLHHIRGGKLLITQSTDTPLSDAPQIGELDREHKQFCFLYSEKGDLFVKAVSAGCEFSFAPAILSSTSAEAMGIVSNTYLAMIIAELGDRVSVLEGIVAPNSEIPSGVVVLALDSLTQGDGTEDRESFAWAMMQELYDNNSLAGWFYAPQGDSQSLMRDPYTSQVTDGSAFYPISAQSSDKTVMQYSMSGLGTQTLGNQLTTDSITISTSISWESADVYFLATETDSYTGSFDVVASETVTADASVQTNEIGKVTVTNSGDNQILITNSSGKTCICFVHFKTGQAGVDILNAGLGGRTAANFSEINTHMDLWNALLTPKELILNGGMNDRSLSTAEEFETDMRSILSKFSDYDVLIVHPAQNSDNGVGIFDDVYSQIGVENEYFDIPNLYGDYDTFVENGWMDDFIHPNTIFNRMIGSVFAKRYYT